MGDEPVEPGRWVLTWRDWRSKEREVCTSLTEARNLLRRREDDLFAQGVSIIGPDGTAYPLAAPTGEPAETGTEAT